MNKADLLKFISRQKSAVIGSVGEDGYPVVRAMNAPRKIQGNEIYFSTNTSSKKVAQFLENDKACIYFYKRGLFRYKGAAIMGRMTVCTDQPTKDMIWKTGDTIFYKKGVTDPDYCVLKFTCERAEYYCDLKKECINFEDSDK